MVKDIVAVLFFELLLTGCVTQDNETRASCKEDVSLECGDVDFTRMNFISVAWYKLHNDKKQGIIRKYKDTHEPKYYNFSRPTSIGDRHNLILTKVMPKDSGVYECGVNANVGSKNVNHKVNLYVSDCLTEPSPTTMRTILNTTQCSHRVEDVPIVWSVTGYLAVGVAKVILSLFAIWVIRRIGIRSRRHKHTG